MKKFRFRNFPIYKDVREFRLKLKNLIKSNFPKEEQFVLTSQILRAMDSVVLNIAEGADRKTDTDFAHFLNISHTSLNEVVSCLDLAYDDKYIDDKKHIEFLELAEGLANQLTAFRIKLLNDSKEE